MSGRLTLLDALPTDSTGSDGRISGTPAALHPVATYTLTAMDRDGDRATLMLILTIEQVRVMNAAAHGREGGAVVFPGTVLRPVTLIWTVDDRQVESVETFTVTITSPAGAFTKMAASLVGSAGQTQSPFFSFEIRD